MSTAKDSTTTTEADDELAAYGGLSLLARHSQGWEMEVRRP
jgi:hypothetical protein